MIKMKYEEIHEMLDRYWEGETTLEEERRIKAYFKAGAIDERLLPVAPMFQALREEQAVQLDTKAKITTMRPQMYIWAAAASVALLLTAGWCFFRDVKEVKTETPIALQAPKAQPESQEKAVVEAPINAIVQQEKIIPKTVSPKKTNTPIRSKPQEIDPETAQAMAEIKAALALVSSKLDKGRNEAVKGASHLDALEKVPKRKEG